MSLREDTLRTAIELTCGDRPAAYGDPVPNLGLAGRLKAEFRRSAQRKLGAAELEAVDQVLTKLARIATGPIVKQDNYVDGAAYLAIAYECAVAERADALASDVAAEIVTTTFGPLESYSAS